MKISLNFLAILNLLGAAQGLLLTLALLKVKRGNRTSNRLLAALALTISVVVTGAVLVTSNYVFLFPHLEQVVTEHLDVAREAYQRWKDEDDGIHVFAVALYELMRQEHFSEGRENFSAFLKRMFSSGRFSPGKIKPLYDEFYSSFPTSNL